MASFQWNTAQDRSPSHDYPEESFFWRENLNLDFEFEDEKEERKFHKQLFNLFIEDFCMNQKVPLKKLITRLEKTILIRTLSRFNGNQKSAAEFLGLKPTTLNEKVKKYKIHFQKRPVEK
jgi:DNA-binding NtrC family response regulator